MGVLALVLFSLLFGCNVSVGTETDLSTGLKVDHQGLSFDDSYLTIDDVKVSSNKVDLGKKIKLVFNGLKGFKEIDGVVFMDASMKVTSPSGEVVLDQNNLFAAYQTNGADPDLVAKGFSLTLTVGEPMVSGETYLWESKVWDAKGNGTVSATVNIVVN